MKNADLFDTIKTINRLMDEIVDYAYADEASPYYIHNQSDEIKAWYRDIDCTMNLLLDSITIKCPRWKYYHAYEVRQSNRTKHYYIVFSH